MIRKILRPTGGHNLLLHDASQSVQTVYHVRHLSDQKLQKGSGLKILLGKKGGVVGGIILKGVDESQKVKFLK